MIETETYLNYCSRIADEFQTRLNRLRSFVKHNASSGTANESILRSFLSTHAPSNYVIGEGFICNPFERDVVSRQCDILVFDQAHFPMVYSDGPISVVLPRAARLVIEVKTKLKQRNDVWDAIENISSAKATNSYLKGVIFAFQSASLEAISEALASYPKTFDPELGPTALLLLDKDVVIHNWGWSRQRELEGCENIVPYSYAILGPKDGAKGIVMITLLSLMFQATDAKFYEADVNNLLMQVFDQATVRRLADVAIGERRIPYSEDAT